MERMTVRDGLIVKLKPAFRTGDFASQNVLHRLADLEDAEELKNPSELNEEETRISTKENVVFTTKELEAIAFALEHLHDADLSFMDTNIVKGLENAMDKLNIDYTSQLL